MIEEVTHDIMEICNKIFTNIDSVSVNEKEKNHLDSVYKELDILNKI